MTARTPLPSPVRSRSWAEIRWRQFRNAPRPVFRAVASDAAVAAVLGAAYLGYDVALTRGARLPGGDLRVLAAAIMTGGILVVGSVASYLVVPHRGLLGRDGGGRSHSPWSAALGFFAAVPIAYLTLVLVVQVLEPLLA